jgi:hypothetical protein
MRAPHQHNLVPPEGRALLAVLTWRYHALGLKGDWVAW